MTTIRRTILTGSATLVLAALLSGCSSAGGDLNSLIPSVGQALSAETPTATPTPAVIAGDTDGNGKLSEFEKEQLANNAPRDYQMPDGSVATIDPTQPLPAAVVAAIKAESSELGARIRSTPGAAKVEFISDLVSYFDDESTRTGKGIIFVYETTNYSFNAATQTLSSEHVYAAQASNGNRPGVKFSSSKDETVSAAEAWAQTRGYEVIVVE